MQSASTGHRLYLAAKRALDLLAAISLLSVLAPFMGLAAALICLSSPGPVFFRQQRVGYSGKLFWFYKFRTMYVEAPAHIQSEAQALQPSGILFKRSNDPRITPVGRWLRRFSIDELPQLFNVLKGEMSMVGPRPLVPFMLGPYPQFAAERARVKPGITGLWQLRARAQNTSAAFMQPHDLEYVRNPTLWTDFKILLATPLRVLLGKGAI